MAVAPEIAEMLARLAELAVKNSAGMIYTRIQSVRARKTDETTVNELTEIINELVDEKSQLITIARGLESQLVAQRISDDDLTYIIENLVPTVEKLIEISDEEDRSKPEIVEMIKEVLSKETFEILQLVGFNFKAAIGQPLTEIVERLITTSIPGDPNSSALELVNAQRELVVAQITQDPEAYARLRRLYGHEE